jgi:hypothetical protein
MQLNLQIYWDAKYEALFDWQDIRGLNTDRITWILSRFGMRKKWIVYTEPAVYERA